MPISFEQIQPNTLLPLFYAEVTSAQEPIAPNLKLCLIGYMNKGVPYREGTAIAETPYLLSGSKAREYFGPGSMLEWQYQKARMNAPAAEIWGVAVPEEVDPVPARAVATITIKVAATRINQGFGMFWIGGRPITFRASTGDTTATLALHVAARINGSMGPFKATAAAAVVTLTCRWNGASGNQINISYVGPGGRNRLGQEVIIARRFLDITQPADGSGETPPQGAFASVAGRQFDVFTACRGGLPFLDACADFMDHIGGRWSPYVQLYGHMVVAAEGGFQTLYELGEDLNDPHLTILGYMQSVMPHWEWAAALAGQMVTHWAAPPELSRPLQTIELRGMQVGNEDDDSFSKLERQQLLEQGISTFHVDNDTTCRIDRVRTLRKTNVWGDPDPSWADAITMFQAQFFVRAIRRAITGAFPRAALTTNDSGIPGFASPNMIRQVVIHEYKQLQKVGLVENVELFAQFLIVERNQFDANRVDILARPDMVNQLRVVAALVETHLELDSTDPMLQVGTGITA